MLARDSLQRTSTACENGGGVRVALSYECGAFSTFVLAMTDTDD